MRILRKLGGGCLGERGGWCLRRLDGGCRTAVRSLFAISLTLLLGAFSGGL
jgi:hypothetical protein